MSEHPTDLGTRTRLAGVIGDPIHHSRSPALHNAAYAALGMDAVYLAFKVHAGHVAAALHGARALGLLGLNVTVPHKHEALDLCDEVEDDARMARAVNTVTFDGHRIRGANTDITGFGRSLDERRPEKPTRAVVLGAGGAARAVVLALGRRQIPCAVVARDADRARALISLGASEAAPWSPAALADFLAGADLLVDATSAGLSPEAETRVPAPVPLDKVAASALVVSLAYHREPALLEAARGRGLETLDGAAMLVYQAASAFELMTGKPAPLEAMWAAFRSGDGTHR